MTDVRNVLDTVLNSLEDVIAEEMKAVVLADLAEHIDAGAYDEVRKMCGDGFNAVVLTLFKEAANAGAYSIEALVTLDSGNVVSEELEVSSADDYERELTVSGGTDTHIKFKCIAEAT